MTDWVKILKKIPETWTIPSRRSVQELIDDDELSKALIIANLNVKKWPKNPDFWLICVFARGLKEESARGNSGQLSFSNFYDFTIFAGDVVEFQ